MDPKRSLFDAIVDRIYGENIKHLNTESAYEALYLDICEVHDKLTEIKKEKEYPLSLFSLGNTRYLLVTSDEILYDKAFSQSINNFLSALVKNIFPYEIGLKCIRINMISTIFGIYFLDDLLEFNNGEITIAHVSTHSVILQLVKRDMKTMTKDTTSLNKYCFVLPDEVYNMCI